MSAAWQTFREAGWIAWIILLFGLAGLAAAIAAATLAALRSRVALWAGVAATILSALTASLGGIGVLRGRAVVDGLVAGGVVRPVFHERIRREGYREAQSAGKIGLFFAIFPLLAGSIAMFTAPRRRDEPRRAGEISDAGPAVPLVITGAGLLASGFAFIEARAPLPGRDIPVDDPLWELMEHTDTVQSSTDEDEVLRSCRRIEASLSADRVPDASAKVTDLAAAEARCVERRTAVAQKHHDVAALRDLEGSIFVIRHPEQKAAVSAARAKLESDAPAADSAQAPEAPMRAPVALGTPTVKGALPPEVIRRVTRGRLPRIRACIDRAPAATSASGEVQVRFVIGADGEVKSASDAGTTREARAALPCLLQVFKATTYPRPGSGVVSVVYPIIITGDR